MPDTEVLRDIKATLERQTSAINASSIQMAQTIAKFAGFEELMRSHIADFDRDHHRFINDQKIQDAKIAALETGFSDLRHTVKNFKTFPMTVTSLLNRVQTIEKERISEKGQKTGIKNTLHYLWVVIGALGAVIGWFLSIIFRGHTP